MNIDWQKASEYSWRALVFVVAIGLLIIVSTRWTRWQGGPGWQITNDAYLQADLTPVAAKVAGYVSALPIQDYQHVHSGELLAQLVDSDYLAAVEQAQANLLSAVAQAETLKAQRLLQDANVQAARAVVTATTATLDQNARDLARQRRLLETGSSSTEMSEKLDTTRAQLTAQVAQNRAQTESATRQLAVLASQQAQAEAAVAAQKANVQLALINLGYTKIVAPQDGVI
jgi:membrane fusion protein (multidrug efflux system)